MTFKGFCLAIACSFGVYAISYFAFMTGQSREQEESSRVRECRDKGGILKTYRVGGYKSSTYEYVCLKRDAIL